MLIRHTKTRQAVLRAVKMASAPLTAEQVLYQVRRWQPAAGPATVYRNLKFLAQRGEIYQVEGIDGTNRFIGHVIHEAKFRCQRCGDISEWPRSVIENMIKTKSSGQRAVFFSRLTAQGLCASCLAKLKKINVRLSNRML